MILLRHHFNFDMIFCETEVKRMRTEYDWEK